jgi:Fe-Mn family superoxide dismutase
MTKYILPDLTYDYGALEPHLSGKIMELHHDKRSFKRVRTRTSTKSQASSTL